MAPETVPFLSSTLPGEPTPTPARSDVFEPRLLERLAEHLGHPCGDRLRPALQRRLVALVTEDLVIVGLVHDSGLDLGPAEVDSSVDGHAREFDSRTPRRCGRLEPRPLGNPAARRAQVPDLEVHAAARAGAGSGDRPRSPRRCPGSGSPPSTTQDLLGRIRDGEMTVREQRGLGLPWSEVLVERGRRSVGGTAGRGAARPGARPRHEPRRRHPPRRPRLRPRLLPVQRRRRDGGGCARRAYPSASWSSTATSTRATAPPRSSARTPTRSRSRCTARATTRSCASRPTSTRPSSGTGDDEYLARLSDALDIALDGDYDLAFFLAGADPWEGDRLGRLSLTKPGLRARDELVLRACAEFRPPWCSPAGTPRTSKTPSISTRRRSTFSPVLLLGA